jgi:hypothetical protein
MGDTFCDAEVMLQGCFAAKTGLARTRMVFGFWRKVGRGLGSGETAKQEATLFSIPGVSAAKVEAEVEAGGTERELVEAMMVGAGVRGKDGAALLARR